MKNRLITCSTQSREKKKKKVVKRKTTAGNELIADWRVWVDRISAQKGQKRDWTRSSIFCFREAQLAFYKHTSTHWSFTSTNTKAERGSLNLQQASSPRAGAESNPTCGIKWELLHLAVLFQYFHQYKPEHWGETASVFQTVLSTDDQKAWGKNPQAVWTQVKHHPLCPCRQFSSSGQLIISAATYSTHLLQSQRKFPLSLVFLRASIQYPSSH